jgi:iron complex transport system substrate-binding protein
MKPIRHHSLIVISIALFLLAAFLPLTAAGTAETPAAAGTAADSPVTYVDDLGTEVTLPGTPQTVISLSLFSDEVLMELLPPESFPAVSTMAVDPNYSNVAEKAAGISPVIDFNVETIISIYPDLVIAANWSEAEKISQLRQAGIAVYQINTPFDIAGIKTAILRLGELTGSTEAAEKLNAELDRRLEKLAEKTAALKQSERLSAVDYNSWGTANGSDTTWNLILSLAGIDNAAAAYEAGDFGQVPLSKEVLLEANPDIMFLPSYIWGEEGASDAFYRQVINDPALASINAVAERRVYIFPERLKNSYSHYLVDAAEAAAQAAYPSLFE